MFSLSDIDAGTLFYFIFTDVTEVFSVYIKLVFFVVNQVLVFYLLYHSLIFISPGLYKSEYSYLTFVFKVSISFFLLSAVIFNKFLFPFSWKFFLSFQEFILLNFFVLHFEAKLVEYLDFYVTLYCICILYFQVFMFLVLFFDYVKRELKTIQSFRKVFYFFFVVFSTLATPPDVFSQLLLSSCLVLGYEVLMFYFIIRSFIKNH